MCLAIPGQVVAIGPEPHLATVEVSSVRRKVNIDLLQAEAVAVGDWVLIHVGFAMSKVDEAEAQSTREFLEQLGEPYEQELAELESSSIE